MHLAILSCWTLIVLLFLARTNSFLTQNAFYHSRLATCLWQEGCQLTIAHSRFADRFIDQHLGFHALLGGLQKILPVEIAAKILTTILFFVLGWLVVRKVDRRSHAMSAVIFGAAFFLLFPSRLLLGRPQLMGAVALLIVWMWTEKRKSPIWLALLGFLASLVSFETSLLLLGFSILLGAVDPTRRPASLAIGLGALSTLFVFPFGLEKSQYFLDLLFENVSNSSGIREWEAPGQLPFALIAGWVVLLTLGRKEILRDIIWFGLALASMALTLFAVRFEYLAVLLLILGMTRTEVLSRIKSKRFVAAIAALVGLSSAFWHYRTFHSDPTVFDSRPVARWLQRHRPGEAIFNWRWEYWSSLVYADPHLVSAPGFSPLIHQEQSWFPSYRRLRDPGFQPQIRDLRQMLTALKTRLILIDHRSGASIKLKQMNWPLAEVYTDPQFSVFEYASNRGAEPAVRPLSLEKFRSKIRDVLSSALGWNWREIYYKPHPFSDLEPARRVRRLQGILAFCKLAPGSEQCLRLVQSIQKLDREEWDLGTWSLWGMILTEAPIPHRSSGEVRMVHKQVESFYDLQRKQWKIRPGPGSHFQIGEALSFLATQTDFQTNAWIKAEIQAYAQQFRITEDFLRVRWLLGMLGAARAKNPEENWIAEELDIVLSWLNRRQNQKGCLTDPYRALSLHVAGLMLEGLSYLQNVMSAEARIASLTAGFERCALTETPAEMYQRGDPIDVLGHVGNAVANLTD